MKGEINIGGRRIGPGHPTYIVAEMSANHNRDFDTAVEIIKAAREAGADAVKLQTYTPDTLTIDCDNEYFRIKGTLWQGKTLYELYAEAYTPWEWQPRLKEVAESLGMDLFSTPFDSTAVRFLEEMDVPAYKVASFELVDIPLLRTIALTGKPIIMSTGMATLAEIDEAVSTIRKFGKNNLALLKCTSAYPALPEEMNLYTIPDLREAFGTPVGLSDHSVGIVAPVVAVSLGANIIEKHLTLSRSSSSTDGPFSLDREEFMKMVNAVREAEKVLGQPFYGVTQKESASVALRKSLFIVRDMEEGEEFTPENLRSVRPGNGLHTRYFQEIMGKRAAIKITMGTPLSWDLVR